MINPYYKEDHTATIVEVEDFGVINLNDLPIPIHEGKKGKYEICWVQSSYEGKHILPDVGGSNRFNWGGRPLGVIKEIE